MINEPRPLQDAPLRVPTVADIADKQDGVWTPLPSLIDVALDERRLQPRYEKSTAPRLSDHPLLKFFRYEHLPEALREVSKPFGMLASEVCRLTPTGAEQTVALRKLLEAKDAAVRAKLEVSL